jgi:hypothetical protein
MKHERNHTQWKAELGLDESNMRNSGDWGGGGGESAAICL